jgi:hypothetical protein
VSVKERKKEKIGKYEEINEERCQKSREKYGEEES